MGTRGPTFLLLGAMKAGTTSVFRYLRQHPDIFMDRKEPGFFAVEGGRQRWIEPPGARAGRRARPERWEDYAALFADAPEGAATGDCSTMYLCDKVAPERIRHYVPEARLMAILRQPVDRAYSAYMMKRRTGAEPLSFEEALEAEPERIEAGWPYGWHYAALGRYREALERYRRLFPPDQLEVVLYDDFEQAPLEFLQRLFRHIGVEDTFRPDLSKRHNPGHTVRLKGLARWMKSRRTIRAKLKRFFPGRSARRLYEWADRWHRRWNWVPAQPLDPELRARLTQRFRDDILEVEDLLDRDLSHWLESSTP